MEEYNDTKLVPDIFMLLTVKLIYKVHPFGRKLRADFFTLFLLLTVSQMSKF